jgi:hypothetical protein
VIAPKKTDAELIKFCAEMCSPTSESCFARGRKARNLEPDVDSCAEIGPIMMYCAIAKTGCERYCGIEGVNGFAAANAADPIPASCRERRP